MPRLQFKARFIFIITRVPGDNPRLDLPCNF